MKFQQKESEKMTTLADIYKAAVVDTLSMNNLQPFDIVLTVIPQGLSMIHGAHPTIELAVLIKEVMRVDGSGIEFIDRSFEIELPVDQVRILDGRKRR